MNSEEKNWRAEQDMRILAEADKIKGDRSRLNAITDYANKQKQIADSLVNNETSFKEINGSLVPQFRNNQ